MSFKWICPYCSMTQTVVRNQTDRTVSSIGIEGGAEGSIGIETSSIGCSNPDCLKTTVNATIGEVTYTNGYRLTGNGIILKQRLLPQGTAKPQPDYIPRALVDDYYEACLIRELSPKASATLIRRCLQGMIRDFAGIKKGKLIDEIKALRASVEDGSADRSITPETVDAIDHVRDVGNIGAHMEKDINLIIDVDPGEAQALIELVELLFEEWYVARNTRQKRLERIALIAEAKKAKKIAPQAPPTALDGQAPLSEEKVDGGVNALLGLVKALETKPDSTK